jgi:hypothetical protein
VAQSLVASAKVVVVTPAQPAAVLSLQGVIVVTEPETAFALGVANAKA